MQEGPLTLIRAMQLYQVMRLGSVILTSILLAKSGMRLGDIGHYEALLYLGSAVAFFWANGLLQAIPPVYARLPEADQPAFFFQKFLLFGVIAFVLTLALWLGRHWFLPALTGLPEVPGLGVFCVYLFFNLATLPVEYLYLLKEKPLALMAWGALSFGLYVAVLVVPVFWGYGLEGGLLGLACLGGVRFFLALTLLFRYAAVQWRPRLLQHYLTFALPLVLNLLVGNLVILFDSWLVGWYYSDEAVFAVFRYGSREFPLATALATALGLSMITRLAQDPAKGLAELKSETRRLFHVLFPTTIALVFLARPLFPVVFSQAFSDSAPLFAVYLLLTASRVLLPNAIVLALGRPGAILAVGLLELTVKVALGFWFIQWWGLAGVAWSAVIAFWVEKIGLIWYLERRLKVSTADWLDWQWYLGYTIALMAAFLLA